MTSWAPQRWFWLGCLFEAMLAVVAVGIGVLLNAPLLACLRWSGSALVLGAIATLPLFLLFVATLSASGGFLAPVREFLDRVAQPVFGHWAVWQLAAVSILAGIGEELLFRGAIQAGLTPHCGTMGALLIASASFGLCHWINRSYAILASLVGVYLGALFLVSDNLLAPILCHSAYDFVALVWLRRGRRLDGADDPQS